MKAKNVNSEQEYRDYISDMVDTFLEEKLPEIREDVHHHIKTEINQDRMYMMCSNNMKPLQFSRNNPENWHMYVGEREKDHRKVIQAMCFSVMRIDFMEELRNREEIEL